MPAGTGIPELTSDREIKQKVHDTPPAGERCEREIGNIKVIIRQSFGHGGKSPRVLILSFISRYLYIIQTIIGCDTFNQYHYPKLLPTIVYHILTCLHMQNIVNMQEITSYVRYTTI